MYLLLFCFVSACMPFFTSAVEKGGAKSSSLCLLPGYPEHGTYKILNLEDGKPGQSFESVALNYTCQPPYRIVGRSSIFCVSGVWSEPLPKCNRFCKLEQNPSVEYKCLGAEGRGPRTCDEYEPNGAVVIPTCRVNYYSSVILSNMECLDGAWNYVALCSAECGRIAPEGDILVLDSRKSNKLPWYAAIYTKSSKPYMQICGGTLISPTAVVSAAHCFWGMDKIQPKENYAVALGKTHRPWMSPLDDNAHQSDVKDLHIPPQFTGLSTNYRDDIAVVVMADPVVYKVHIHPVCLSFEIQFEKQQLRDGHSAKVGIWGYNITTQKLLNALRVVNVPYVDQPTCIARSPASFRPYITADKMCVGYENGSGPCRGDGGTGLVFPTHDRGVERYYLRGVVSTGPVSDDGGLCSLELVTATMLSRHEHFIKEVLGDKNI